MMLNAQLRAKLKSLSRQADRALQLDREPQMPSGMSTGDMLVVGVRDWHRLMRLARAARGAHGPGGCTCYCLDHVKCEMCCPYRESV